MPILIFLVLVQLLLGQVCCQEDGCYGVTITADTGLLTSPGFGSGNPYENEVTCLWIFDVPYDYVVHLEFHTVEMEDSYQCLKDGILIFTPEETMFTFCGTYTPPPITVTEFFGIAFYTDSSVTDNGFNLTYTQINMDVTCDVTLYTKFGTIAAPVNMGGNYSDNTDCIWTIISRYDRGAISIKVTEMDIVSDNPLFCDQDYLRISDDTNYPMGKFCGRLPLPLFQSTTRALFLDFHSDETDNGRGFMAYYAMRDERQSCGGISTHARGTINDFETGTFCQWLLVAPKGSLIKLKFLSFSLYRSSNCSEEYLSIKDYFGNESARLCGHNVPPPLTSSTNSLLLTYQHLEYSSLSRDRFEIEYTHITHTDDMTTLVDDYTTWGGFVPTEAYEFDITTYMSRHSLGLDQESTQAKPYTREIKPYTPSDKPYTQSDKPYTQNAKTYKQSEKPLTRSDKPLTRSDKPLIRSDKPLTRSDKPLTRSDKPLTRSDKPLTRSDKPLTRSDKPLTRSDKPLTRSDKPYIQTTASGSLGNDAVTQTTGVPRVSDWKNDSYPENNSTKQGNVEENSTPESDFVWNTSLADSGFTEFGAFLPTIILVVCASLSNALMQNL